MPLNSGAFPLCRPIGPAPSRYGQAPLNTWPARVNVAVKQLPDFGQGRALAMDIHKPKPVRHWRELLTEVGVIVLSVCIALAAEQAVEWAHWRCEVSIARKERCGPRSPK